MKLLYINLKYLNIIIGACFVLFFNIAYSENQKSKLNTFKENIHNKVDKYVNKFQSDTLYCSQSEESVCPKNEKYWNYYSSVLGGPFLYYNGEYLGFTLDFVPIGVQITNGRDTHSFEVKFFNQFFDVDSQKVGAKESFDVDAVLNGAQFKYLRGRKLLSNPKIKPFYFVGADLGYARMKGFSQKSGDINLHAPTFGFAVGGGFEYQISKNVDIGFEVPFGLTILYHSQTGFVPFPDIFPNFSIKYHY